MKRTKLAALSFCLLIILTSVLTGCNAKDKLELLNAFDKTSRLNSFESQSQLRFTNVSFDTNIEDLMVMQDFVPLLDNLKFDMHQKSIRNDEKTRIRSQMDMKVTSADFTDETTMWADYDMTSQPPKMKQIVKLPQLASAGLPAEEAAKEYLVMDQGDMLGAGGFSTADYTQYVQSMSDIQTQLVELLKDYALNKDPDFVAINQLPDKVVNGEKLSAYQLKLDNNSLKTVLKYALSEISTNEQAKNLIAQFMLAASSISGDTEGGRDMDMAFKALRDGNGSIGEDLKKISNALENVAILGNRGIVMDFLVNKDGYIVNQSGVMDFHIDSQQLENAFEKVAGDTGYEGKEIYKFVFSVAMEFNTDMYNINEDIQITFPETNEQNSIDLNDAMIPAPELLE